MTQHIADLRFFPAQPIASTLAMEADANGILQSVSPTSTAIAPIAMAVFFACAKSGKTPLPTATTNPFMQDLTRFEAFSIPTSTRSSRALKTRRSMSSSGVVLA